MMEKNRNRIPIDTMTRPTQPIQQPDRPELLSISVGELAAALFAVDPMSPKHGPTKWNVLKARKVFAEIQRQRDTLQGDETEDLSRTYGDE